MLDGILVPLHKAGWPFVAGFAVASLLLGLIDAGLFWIGVLATAWCAYFFRDPPRAVPAREGLVVAPADGRVQAVAQVVPPDALELGEEARWRISIFLNVFDVHVNRIPVSGRIARIVYRHGKFLNASLDKASDENERNALTIETVDGQRFGVVQIAGLVARRIVCEVHEGQDLRVGERFGIIRFGSRTDLYLPPGVAPLVAPGQRMLGGETVVADLMSQEGPRRAETI